MNKDNDGGFLVPEVVYIDNPSKGWIASVFRYIGQRIINLGVWIRSFGYYQIEIHPQQALIEEMKRIRVIK